MIKIMLVEDDKSLREIYGVRLLAEGYDIVSAGDGEEALAMAIKERPQLIISDVMMPKVSGYDMLDILRSTTETKNIRVIMMTALSSEEQRTRAESLGADRYLVKSQVGIEDVVRVVHEVLEDIPVLTPPPIAVATPASQATPVAPVAVQAAPVTPAYTPTSSSSQPQTQPIAATMPAPFPTTPQPSYPTVPFPTTTTQPITQPVMAQAPTQPPQPSSVIQATTPRPITPGLTSATPSAPKPLGEAPKPASLKTRIIQPISDPSISPININDLLDKELAKEAGISENERPVVESVSQERAQLEEQLQAFTPPELTPVQAPPLPTTPAPQTAASVLPTPGVSTENTPVVTQADPTMAMPAGLTTIEPSQQPTLAPPVVSLPVPPTPPTPAVAVAPQPSIAPMPMPTPTSLPMQQVGPLESPSTTTTTGPDPVLPEVPKI